MPPKIAILDIETAPNLSYVWGKYEQDVIENVRDWYILGFAYKWLGEDKVHTHYICDYPGKPTDDKKLAKDLWRVLDEADIVVAHYGDRFDIPRMKTRLAVHGYPPPSPFKSIDTKKVAKQYFAFDSNKLDDLGIQLGLGRKMSTGGFATWRGCMMGDKKAFKTMRAYNEQDVLLLEKLYLRLRPWISPHPNTNVYTEQNGCPNCGGKKTQKRGFSVTATGRKQRYHCQAVKCGAWSHGPAQQVKQVQIR